MARTMFVQAWCRDLCSVGFPNGSQHQGYVPEGIGIGGADSMEIEIDIDTGQVVGWNDTVRDAVLKMQEGKAE